MGSSGGPSVHADSRTRSKHASYRTCRSSASIASTRSAPKKRSCCCASVAAAHFVSASRVDSGARAAPPQHWNSPRPHATNLFAGDSLTPSSSSASPPRFTTRTGDARAPPWSPSAAVRVYRAVPIQIPRVEASAPAASPPGGSASSAIWTGSHPSSCSASSCALASFESDTRRRSSGGRSSPTLAGASARASAPGKESGGVRSSRSASAPSTKGTSPDFARRARTCAAGATTATAQGIDA
mmetsp:Transcript_6710/g.22326  ORF Transcript_6710/g.22326 Transcript_6710/m.22326 type:complete len:241 (-) Transcript_6710:345-1067(-)